MSHIEITRIFGKKTIGLTFFLGAAVMMNAQEKQSIKGKITDQNDAVVPYASIEFNNKTNAALSDASMTDDSGSFALNLANGTYQVIIDAVNFKRKTYEIEIQGAANLGNIVLEPETSKTANNSKSSSNEKQISEVVITAKSSAPYKVELDKKTYNVGQDISSKGGTLHDVLNNVPSVSVETDGSVSMRGNSNVKFLINGKPSSVLGITDDISAALKSIPADQIDRIEIITNPSSKFEAEGTAGILNIILKKTSSLGFNGSVNGSLGYNPATRLNTNLSWNYGKWTWFVNGGGGYMKNKSQSYSDILYKNTGESLTTSSENKPEMKNYNFNTGFTYSISDKTSVNASFSANRMLMDGFSLQQNTSSLTGITYRKNDGLDENKSIQVDAGIEHKFNNKGHMLELSGSFQNTSNNSEGNIFDNRNTFHTLYQYLNVADFSRKTWIGKLDYELPIGENSKIEAGARYDYNNNDINNSYQGLSGGSFITFDDVTGKNNYTEQLLAFYAQFKSKIGKFGYQLGVRNENINIDIEANNNLTGLSTKSKKYNEFFPSVFLSYDITEKSQFSLNYSRRIKRPKSWEIIPVMRISGDPNRFMGNSDLNPSFVNSFEFSYNYSRAKWNINPTLYYQRTTDEISSITEEQTYIHPITGQPTEYILSRPFNLGTEDRYGLDLSYSVSPTSWFRVYGNVNLYRYKSELTYNNSTIVNEGNNLKAKLTSAFKINRTTNLQLQGDFRGGHRDYNTEKKNTYALNIGISKNIWNNTGTISFSVQDVFNSRKRRTYTDSDTFTRYNEMQMMPRQFLLSFSYRFKSGNVTESKTKRKPEMQDQNNDDMNEAGYN